MEEIDKKSIEKELNNLIEKYGIGNKVNLRNREIGSATIYDEKPWGK